MVENFPKFQQYVDSWPKCFSDWEIKFWSLRPVLDLMRSLPNGDAIVATFHKLPNKGAQSDFARYVIVYIMGGMYADTDMECLRNFSFLLQEPSKNLYVNLNQDFLTIETTFAAPSCNHWFYCPYPKFDGLLQMVTKIARTKVPAHPPLQWTLNVTGPFALSKMCVGRNDVGYISWHLLEGKSLSNCLHRYKSKQAFPCAYAIHHHGGTWLPKTYSGKMRAGVVSVYGFTRQNS